MQKYVHACFIPKKSIIQIPTGALKFIEFKAGKIAVFVQIYCNNEPLKLSKNPRICLSCLVNMAPGTQTMLLIVLVLKIHSFKLQI